MIICTPPLITDIFFIFQTLLGVSSGQLLDNVITQSAAIKLVLFAWSYSTFVGLMLALHGIDSTWLKIQQHPCQMFGKAFSRTSRTLFSGSIIMMAILVILTQTALFIKMHHRLNIRVAPEGVAGRNGNRADSGINMLYKRAMGNSALIAISFMVGWVPICIVMLLYDWGHLDQDTLVNVGFLLIPLCMMQGLANAVIFRARNISIFLERIFNRCSCR